MDLQDTAKADLDEHLLAILEDEGSVLVKDLKKRLGVSTWALTSAQGRLHERVMSRGMGSKQRFELRDRAKSVQLPRWDVFGLGRKRAESRYEAELAKWQEQHDKLARLLSLAETFEGEDTADDLLLKPGETRFARFEGAGLVEPRRERGQWVGSSSGFSIPVGSIGGRSVRYRTSGTRGTYSRGAEVPTVVDTGTVHVTSQRVVFQGSKATRECLFGKLVGIQSDSKALVTISVTNRQKPTVIHPGRAGGELIFWIELAVAHYRGEVAQFVAEFKDGIAEFDESKPVLGEN